MANTQVGTDIYPYATSTVTSTYRRSYTVETLTRIHRVTGQSFAISGDAPLRYQRRLMKQRLNEEFGKAAQ